MTIPPAIIERLRHAVDARGWSDTELRQRAGVSRWSVLRLWRGDVSWETVQRVACALRMELVVVEAQRPGADEGFEMLRQAGVRQ